MRGFLSLTAVVLLTSIAWAQDPPEVAPGEIPRPTPKKIAPTKSLKEVIPELRWPVRTRGPLLLLAPERLKIQESILASASSREGVSLTTLAPLTGQKIEHYGNLSVLAPLTMPVMGIPTDYLRTVRAGMRYGSSSVLLAILNETQWAMLTSENGIGRENLTNDRQRSAWDSMLPSQALFLTNTHLIDPEKSHILSSAQIGALRLRISRRLSIKIGGRVTLFTDEPGEDGEPFGYRNAVLNPEILNKDGMPDTSLFGERANTSEVPYLRKKTDLDPAQLDTTISLSGLATVRELVGRIAKASNLELYVDRRLGGLPITAVTAPDQTVRAGDALAALIRATATAVRAIQAGSERAFVLTFDRIPLSVTSTEISDAMLPILAEQLSQSRPMGLHLPDVWDRIPKRERKPSPDSIWQKGEELNSKPFPLSELPEPFQQRARKIVEDLADSIPVLQRDSATVQAQATTELIAPFWGGATASVGTLPMKSFRPQADFPPVLLPAAPKMRAWQIALPRTAAERLRLISLAADRGVTTLFIPLSGDTREDALFTTLAQEAQARKLTVVPTLCPLQPAPDDMILERDLSLTGRSAPEMNAGRSLGVLTEAMPPLGSFFRRITQRDFVTPEAAPLAAFARRVATLAAIPGVTDVVLAEVVAPGYSNRSTNDFDYLWTGGATPTARLAILRRDGFDPMDIGSGIMGRLAPPLFESSEPDTLLRKFREERREAYLKRLDIALKTTGLRAHLWVAPLLDEGGTASQELNISPWRGKLPARNSEAVPGSLRLYDHAAAAMQAMNEQMDGLSGEEEPNLARRWLGNLFEQNKAQSFVLDFSDLSLSDALKLVEVSIAKKPQG